MQIAVIGIDGSGKSCCYERLLNLLSKQKRVAGIGDKVFVSDKEGRLITPQDVLGIKLKSGLGFMVKKAKDKLTYEISKLSELVVRSKIQEALTERYTPNIVLTDGSPLINMLGWGVYYHPQRFNERDYLDLLQYLTAEKKIPFLSTSFYLKNIPELVLINRVYKAKLQVPDIIFFLKVNPRIALQRITQRGKELQMHEQENFLRKLQEAYIFVCKIMEQHFKTKVFEIDTDNLTAEEVLNRCQASLKPREQLAEINVIATTISGSIKDWKKLDNMEAEFKRYYPSSKVHIVDSHREAFEKTEELVSLGAKIIVSAGGAGTFNSVLEGCCSAGPTTNDLRLAFLRKGSADLIGKVLNIPDKLEPAVKIISEGIKLDKILESDVLEIEFNDSKNQRKKFHMIGFGGLGLFGDIPYFTESRFIKYYKGVLGYLFGDRGPFLTGANLALLKRYLDKLIGKKIKFRIIADGVDIPYKNYANIIIMNGDLGKHFPIAKGIPLGSGDFQVTLMRDRGLFGVYKQMIHAWKGDLEFHKDSLGVEILRTKTLKILPNSDFEYFLNVDGLLKRVSGNIEYRIFSKVKLITG